MDSLKSKKDKFKKQVGLRTKKAREDAGFETCTAMTDEMQRVGMPGWNVNRLYNLEAGIYLAHPLDVLDIAKITDRSPMWIMYEMGPVGSVSRDLQAIRHQNLAHLYDQAGSQKARKGFCKECGIDSIDTYVQNPFKKISDRLARRIEKASGQKRGWLDEQHVESDGLSTSYPADMQELMMIYSELDESQRALLLDMARATQDRLNN